jgi:predicted short-subunit dehydrogenase-like oxidoreductase (DUF2520 family)
MSINSIHTIVFIGAGNVATHLAEAFQDTGRKILQVYSRTENSAKLLADKINAKFTTDLNQVIPDADLYIISVADSALPQLAKKIKTGKSIAVHTSGFYEMNVLENISENIGVFYPLQTFSKNRKIDFLTIPICIEANSEENLKLLEDLALSFSSNIHFVDSKQKKILHLAAVFTSNFTNHMYSIAEEILKNENIPFDILKPLIKETAEKAIEVNPSESQTGPARRNDNTVMEQHLKMLENNDYKELYEKLSEMIKKKYHKK